MEEIRDWTILDNYGVTKFQLGIIMKQVLYVGEEAPADIEN